MSIKILPMRKKDIAEVAKIESIVFAKPWSEESFRNAMLQNNTRFMVAVDGDKVIGYAGYYHSFVEADITNVALLPEYRGCGTGLRLFKRLVQTAIRNGAQALYLEVRESNEPAINMYLKTGFTKVGIRKNYYTQPTENAVVMELLKDNFSMRG